MTTWDEFVGAAPELAAYGAERFEVPGFIYLGSTRVDGWPRVTPVELLFNGGELYLGMSRQRGARPAANCTCSCPASSSTAWGSEGEFKLRGRAVGVAGADERERYGVALEAKIEWQPGDTPFHLFAIDIVDVAKITRDGPEVDDPQQHVEVWTPE